MSIYTVLPRILPTALVLPCHLPSRGFLLFLSSCHSCHLLPILPILY
jgi:hypothetical protein